MICLLAMLCCVQWMPLALALSQRNPLAVPGVRAVCPTSINPVPIEDRAVCPGATSETTVVQCSQNPNHCCWDSTEGATHVRCYRPTGCPAIPPPAEKRKICPGAIGTTTKEQCLQLAPDCCWDPTVGTAWCYRVRAITYCPSIPPPAEGRNVCPGAIGTTTAEQCQQLAPDCCWDPTVGAAWCYQVKVTYQGPN